MCGRFTLTADPDQIAQRFAIDQFSIEFHPRFNIAPGQNILAIISHQGKRRMGYLRWGLIPSWSKDEKIGYKMINAKSETVEQKPSFKPLLARKRCIIPSDSFFEWKSIPSGKQPMRIMMKSGELFAMAGLYDTWIAEGGQKVHTCTILTKQANEIIMPIHDRMPVILEAGDEEEWLSGEFRDSQQLSAFLQRPVESSKLKVYPVSNLVNYVRNDERGCIEEWLG